MKRYRCVCLYSILIFVGILALPMANSVAQNGTTSESRVSTSGSQGTLLQESMLELEEQQKFPASLTDELARLTAADEIEPTLLQVRGNQMTLKGTAPSNPAVVRFMRSLESSSLFQNVELENQKLRDFQITAALDSSSVAPLEGTAQELSQKFLKKKEDIPLLLDQIHTSLLEAGLRISLFTPQAVIPKGGYAEVPVRVEAVGSYQNGMAFTEIVREMDRFVTLRDIETHFDEPDATNMSATIVIYQLLEM